MPRGKDAATIENEDPGIYRKLAVRAQAALKADNRPECLRLLGMLIHKLDEAE